VSELIGLYMLIKLTERFNKSMFGLHRGVQTTFPWTDFPWEFLSEIGEFLSEIREYLSDGKISPN
jgi:hypothetical protein